MLPGSPLGQQQRLSSISYLPPATPQGSPLRLEVSAPGQQRPGTVRSSSRPQAVSPTVVVSPAGSSSTSACGTASALRPFVAELARSRSNSMPAPPGAGLLMPRARPDSGLGVPDTIVLPPSSGETRQKPPSPELELGSHPGKIRSLFGESATSEAPAAEAGVLPPRRPMASPTDLLSQSLNVLQEIKALVHPQGPDYMPEELHVAVVGECVGLAEILSKMGMKVCSIPGDHDATNRVRAARPQFHIAFCDCTPSKVLPAAFVASMMSTQPMPIILTMALGKPWQQQVQACLQAGAASIVTLPTTPEVLRVTVANVLRESHVSRSLQQNVTAHAKLLSHLSKILIEQELYVRSLGEHLSLLDKYKKQSEKLIDTLQKEVEELQSNIVVQQQHGEKLKLENAAMKWKRACDTIAARKRTQAASVTSSPAASRQDATMEAVTLVMKKTIEEEAPSAAAPGAGQTSADSSALRRVADSALPGHAGEDGMLRPQAVSQSRPSTSMPREEKAVGPVQMITHVVRKLSRIDRYLDKADLQNVLMSVVKALSEKEWYLPQYSNLDDQTQMWMDTTFRNGIPTSTADSDETHGGVSAEKDRSNNAAIVKEILTTIDMDAVSSWTFNATQYSHEQLLKSVVAMFDDLHLLDEFGIPVTTLVHFLGTVRSSYQANPYHNFTHACDVAQLCYVVLKRTQLVEYFQRTDSLSLMIAAICHDLDHPGLNNVYQINSKTPLALLYNDVSVLENHHASFAFEILSNEEDNVVANLNSQQITEFRRAFISCVMSTDMIKHFELVSRFESHLAMGPFSRDKKEDRQLLLDIVLHSADISNLVRPQNVSRVWSDLLFEEYLHQGDEEKRMGLPVSPYMDRDDTDQVKMSLNFTDFIARPLFSALAKVFPELSTCVSTLMDNRKWWEARRTSRVPH